MTLEEAKRACMACSSYERMHRVLELQNALPQADWLTLLGHEWEMCDGVGKYWPKVLIAIFDIHRHPLYGPVEGPWVKPEMMTPKELAAFDNLPDEFTIYRGCYKNNMDGMCWTLDEETAIRFPSLMRYRQKGTPLLVAAQVKKERVIALKLGRKEREIVTCKPAVFDVLELVHPPYELLAKKKAHS